MRFIKILLSPISNPIPSFHSKGTAWPTSSEEPLPTCRLPEMRSRSPTKRRPTSRGTSEMPRVKLPHGRADSSLRPSPRSMVCCFVSLCVGYDSISCRAEFYCKVELQSALVLHSLSSFLGRSYIFQLLITLQLTPHPRFSLP